MKKNINETLNKTYKIIKRYIDDKGYPPTVRELMGELGVNSTSTVKYYLDKLEENNLIKRDSNKNRSIELVESHMKKDKNDTVSIPLLGDVAAGNPIFALTNYDEIYEFPNSLFNIKEDLFMLTVKGDSMINAGIFDKDKIIIRKQNYAENTEIIVAMMENSVTVKRFFKEKDIIRLQPENDLLEPIYSKDVKILGKVVGLIRIY